jgi:cellulose synthase/poly-beta-1,6-N-acetylglucosamine synthase-like glycosyltransferase
VVADDGSPPGTARRLERLRRTTGLSIRSVWQPHNGFGKCAILNRAIAAAEADYLVFSDGDCIPRRDFLAQHVRLARPGRMLSGGTVRLPPGLGERLSRDDIAAGRATGLRWLVSHGLPLTRKALLLAASGSAAAVLDRITPTRPTFNGHNASAWRRDVLRVNGFDERMGYGGLDRELGERLANAGIRGTQIRHRAVCVHLDHTRSYVDPAVIEGNRAIRRSTREHCATWTPFGIQQGDKLPAAQPRPLAAAGPARRVPQARHEAACRAA